MTAERLLYVCYLNILFINLIKTQFSFQDLKSMLVKLLPIHLSISKE